jgi:hypothetical protein
MKNTTYILLLICSILCSTTSTAAAVRWDLQPSTFIGGDGVFAGNYQGTISGWFQFDSANPLNASQYSFVFQTTSVSGHPISGYTYSSFGTIGFGDGRPFPSGTIVLGDPASFTIIGFELIRDLKFQFSSTYYDTNVVNASVSIQEVVGDVYVGSRYANTFATATAVPLTSSNLYFAMGLSVLLYYRQRLNQKANLLISHYTKAANG